MATMISEYFSLEDMIKTSHKECDNTPGVDHRKNLEKLCTELLDPIIRKWGKSYTMTSGYRSKNVNSVVGGSLNSDHCKGLAADFAMGSKELNKQFYDMIIGMKDEICWGQLINEDNYSVVHISFPTGTHRGEAFATMGKSFKVVPGSMQKVLGYCGGDV